jgi:hypothetical protein
MQRYLANTAHSDSDSNQVFLNPLVRVSYTPAASKAQTSILQLVIERVTARYVGIAYDIRDWWVRRKLVKDRTERAEKVRKWEQETGEKGVGEVCLIDQMQLLTPNGWAHI